MSLSFTTPVYGWPSFKKGCQVSGSIPVCLAYSQDAKMPFI